MDVISILDDFATVLLFLFSFKRTKREKLDIL